MDWTRDTARRRVANWTAVAGAFAAALTGASAHAGGIEGAPADTLNSLSGAPLMAALAPAEAVADEAENVQPKTPGLVSMSARLQCVPYAREQSGVEIFGDAHHWWRKAVGRFTRTPEPESGAVMVMRGYRTNNRGHVAVVRQILSDRSIIIDHANWLNNGEVTVNVPVVDVSPNGDWTKVRVWHVPTQAWGVRVYTVQGFILPDAEPAGGGVVTTVR
jgi:hypothetical protein